MGASRATLQGLSHGAVFGTIEPCPMPRRSLLGCGRTPATGAMEDLEVVARRFGVDVDSQGGTSHVTFRHPGAGRTTVPKHIPIKPWYVRDFVEFIGKLEDPDHE